MKCLLNWIICIIIPYVLVAMFSVLSMQENIIETYRSVVTSNAFVAILFFYTICAFICNCILAIDDKADYWFIKK